MILADANIWIDHLRRSDPRLGALVKRRRTLVHPYTIGEIALGSFSERSGTLEAMKRLPAAPVARHEEVLKLIDQCCLFGTGVGYVDSHLLASARLVPAGQLWTRDKRLHEQAERLGMAYPP